MTTSQKKLTPEQVDFLSKSSAGLCELAIESQLFDTNGQPNFVPSMVSFLLMYLKEAADDKNFHEYMSELYLTFTTNNQTKH